MKTRILILLVLLNFAALPNLFSQNVSINSTGSLPDTSAMLDVSSNQRVFDAENDDHRKRCHYFAGHRAHDL